MNLLALFGFARSETQSRIPPIFAYLGLVAMGYFAAEVVEAVAHLLGAYAVYLRIPGVVGVALVGHGVYRVVVHRDDHSWGGVIRRYLIHD